MGTPEYTDKELIEDLRNQIKELRRMLEEPPPTMPESCESCYVVDCHGKTKYGGQSCINRVRRALRWPERFKKTGPK